MKEVKTRNILVLGAPIILGMISQNILNVVDMAMVGRLGKHELASVGLGHFSHFVFVALLLGLPVAIQTMSARRLGQERKDEAALALNGGLVLSVIGGLLLLLFLYPTLPWFMKLMSPDPKVQSLATGYLSWRIWAIFAIAMNHTFRGFWNGVNLAKLYLSIMLVMHASNIFMNWLLIYGNLGAPEMGVEGAGLASALATCVGMSLHAILCFVKARDFGFLKRFPSPDEMKDIMKLAIPTGIQQLFFSLGLLCLYWILGKVGVTETAAANVLINLMLLCLLPAVGLGQACNALVSQSVGRGERHTAHAWVVTTNKIVVVAMGTLALSFLAAPDLWFSLFTKAQEVIDLGRSPLRLTGLAIVFDSIGMIYLYSLFGVGENKKVMAIVVSLMWLFFLPGSYLAGVNYGFGLMGIWIIQVVYRGGQTVLLMSLWHSDKWKIKNM
ncbi:MAG: MATE family efflux transporter [Deltaproteobacteria bacterium]|nr:MAG: MATE family efflux transporter [Deltaproteobacteria bacterium]